MSKVKRGPVKVPGYGGDVWFYENQRSIDIFIGRTGADALHCRIPRHKLADWIKRTEPPR